MRWKLVGTRGQLATANQGGSGYNLVFQNTPVSPVDILTVVQPVDGQTVSYSGESASQPWSLNSAGQFIPGSSGGSYFTAAEIPISLDRFEWRVGDVDPYTGLHRTEWDGGDLFRIPSPPGHIQTFPETSGANPAFWVAMSCCPIPSAIDGIFGVDTSFQITGQLHATPGPGSIDVQPMFSFVYTPEGVGNNVRLDAFLGWSTTNPLTNNSQQTQVDLLPTFADRNAVGWEVLQISAWHHFVIQFVLDNTGTVGVCNVWTSVNNAAAQQAVSYTGPIGYGQSDIGAYWKYGLYTSGGAMEIGTAAVMWVANVQVSTTSLASLIGNPLAVPAVGKLF